MQCTGLSLFPMWARMRAMQARINQCCMRVISQCSYNSILLRADMQNSHISEYCATTSLDLFNTYFHVAFVRYTCTQNSCTAERPIHAAVPSSLALASKFQKSGIYHKSGMVRSRPFYLWASGKSVFSYQISIWVTHVWLRVDSWLPHSSLWHMLAIPVISNFPEKISLVSFQWFWLLLPTQP